MADLPDTKSKKKPGRKRRVAGWVLLVIGVLIVGVWGASRWWFFGHRGSYLGIGAQQGQVVVGNWPSGTGLDWASGIDSGGWYCTRAPGWSNWRWIEVGSDPPSPTMRGVNLMIARYRDFFPLGPDISAGATTRMLIIMLWPFALASLLGGGWLVWSGRRVGGRRRAMVGLCRKCGYDLAGLAAGSPCPECGSSNRREMVERNPATSV